MALFLIIWGLCGLLMGVCIVTVLPWTAARMGGRDWIEGVSDRYLWIAQTAARRSALIVRDGDVKLVPKRYDADLKADKDSATGDKRHHRDAFDTVSRLKNKILGIGLTSRDSYVSPLLAELGEETNRAIERQEIGKEESEHSTDRMVDGIHVPEESQLVDLTAARHLTTGASEPEDGQESYIKTKISQEKFHERVSFGQGLLLIIAAIGSMGVAWFGASSGGGGPAPQPNTTVSLLWLLISVADIRETLQSWKESLFGALARFAAWLRSINWGKVFAVPYVLGSIAIVPALAAVTYGPFHAIIAAVLMVGFAVGFPGLIILGGPSIPALLGMPIARGFWILAQLTVGKGVIVERSSGELEHRMLQEAEETDEFDYFTILSDGTKLPIHGSKGDLFRFAWGPMGAVAEKTEENMGSITEDIPATAAPDGGEIMPNGHRQGYQPAVRVPDDDEWLVTLPQLATLCERTSESQSVRQGRQKALTEHGGEQQISTIVFMIMLLLAIIIGGTFGLIAGGAII